MKNVTPKVGQVWSIDDSDFEVSHINGGSGGNRVSVGYGWVNINEFHDKFKFTPQNDLEWLACNVDKWDKSFCMLQRTAKSWEFVNVFSGYNRQQWQIMRYELGLDERPIEIVGAISPEQSVNKAWKLPPEIKQKETKMIDLSNVEVNDKLKMATGTIVDVLFKTRDAVIVGNDNFTAMVDYIGESQHSSPGMSIVGFYDPRHWLKDLPDAHLFDEDVKFLMCGNTRWGYMTKDTEVNGCGWRGMLSILSGIKMPTLTGDEWRNSKISIDELRAWQEQNQ